MNAQLPVATVLALAVLLSSARKLWLLYRQSPPRPRTWRTTALLLAQFASAVLLYHVLFPPPIAGDADTLVVLTAQADQVPGQGWPDARMVALPESRSSDDIRPGAERFPDLASALRHYPATGLIHVIGAGLVARDRDAVRGHAIEFHAAPLPAGLVELHSPAQTPVGRQFAVTGRVLEVDGGSAELRDPADGLVGRSAIDDKGRFELHATARSAGPISYRLQIRDADARIVNDVVVPLQVVPARPLQVLVLAGAPNPELKFLRRWALDAGAKLDTSTSLGAGLQISTSAIDFSAATLDQLDLLVLDTRSWRGLGNTRRTALNAAVDRGLGLLLRLDGPVNADDRKQLAALGFSAPGTGAAREIHLHPNLTGSDFTSSDAADDGTSAALPTLHTSGPPVSAADGVVLLADATGTPVSAWRTHGRGRVGVSRLSDSYRLVLAGRSDIHGELWADAFTTLARVVSGGTQPAVETAASGQRSVICDIGEQASVAMPDGSSVRLVPDPASTAGRCAGFWAETDGWHQLRDGGRTLPFHIPGTSDAPGLAAYKLYQATRALATPARPQGESTAPRRESTSRSTQPGRRLPWFLAWLVLTTGIWWFERARWGTPGSRRGSA